MPDEEGSPPLPPPRETAGSEEGFADERGFEKKGLLNSVPNGRFPLLLRKDDELRQAKAAATTLPANLLLATRRRRRRRGRKRPTVVSGGERVRRRRELAREDSG